jgi:hypothetical protein
MMRRDCRSSFGRREYPGEIMRARWILTIIPPVALTLACAAPQEEVESPKAGGDSEATENAADDAPEADESEAADGSEEPEGRDGPPAAELLTATDIAFDFDFNASPMKEKYEKQCEPLAKDDPAKLAKCVDQKRQTFKDDIVWFRQDPETGELLWLIYQRKGSKLSELFRSPVVFEDEKHESVTVKISGQGRGTRQIMRGRNKFTIMVPTKYGFEIDDPNWGLLKYSSKTGLVQTGNSE